MDSRKISKYKQAPQVANEASMVLSPSGRSALAQGRLQSNHDERYEDADSLLVQGRLPAQQIEAFRGKSEDSAGTPRKSPSRRNHIEAPRSLIELSISDSETSNVSALSGKTYSKNLPIALGSSSSQSPVRRLPKEVLVIEASEEQRRPGTREVTTKAFVVNSPAKVVRHSPSPTRHNADELGARVEVEKPIEIGYVAGKVLPTDESRLSIRREDESSVDEPLSGVEMLDHDDGEDSSSRSARSTTDPVFHGNSSNSSAAHSGTVKKKKNFVPVQSRYMEQQPKPDAKQSNKTWNLSAITPHPTMPAPSSREKKNTVTSSTPFILSSATEGHQPVDGSFLDQTKFKFPPKSVVPAPAFREPVIKKKVKSVKRESNLVSSADVLPSKDVKVQSSDDSTLQEQLDMHYIACLQAIYLNMQLKWSFDKQEEEAKFQMYKAWADNRSLEKEIDAMQSAIENLKQQLAIDQLLQMQVRSLQPATSKLRAVAKYSGELDQAFHNVMQCIPLENILITDAGKLLSALDESRILLAEIHSLTRSRQPKIQQLSAELDVLSKTVFKEIEELEECWALAAATTTLSNHEISLKVQLIEELDSLEWTPHWMKDPCNGS